MTARTCYVILIALLITSSPRLLNSQFNCTMGCDATCPMTFSWANIVTGCTCTDKYECIPIGTCDVCYFDGMEFCYDDVGQCMSYVQSTFNYYSGCCYVPPATAAPIAPRPDPNLH